MMRVFVMGLLAVASLALASLMVHSQSALASDKPKYIKKENEDDQSLIDSLSKTVTDAVGLLSLENKTEGEEGVPRKIAVLPAVATGDPVEERELEDIRTAIHNNLSSKNFDLLKPQHIDRTLLQFEQIQGRTYGELEPKALAEQLGVEGLIFVDVPLVEQVYAAAYAHYKITVRLSFYSRLDDDYIWEKEHSTAERKGGISLDPLSFITQALTSAQVLTEAVRQTLVDKLARIFAAEIPFPIGTRAKIKPINIDLAIANVAEGPFRSGDAVSVFMRAEPNLAATFDLGPQFTGLPMVEQGTGEYVGRYIVNQGDAARDAIVRIKAQRVDDQGQINWRVPGRINIDTQAPDKINDLISIPMKSGIKLTWHNQGAEHETLTYHIERADPNSGRYQELAVINIQEYVDQDIVEGTQYHYRLHAQDEAQNQSAFTDIQVVAVGVGPTNVTEDIIGDQHFYAVASPYIIHQPRRVLRNATLTLSPGTLVEFVDAGKLEVLGTVQALGNAKAPITFSGESLKLVFTNTGENQSRFTHTQFNQGTIEINQSSVHFAKTSFKGMQPALNVYNNSKLVLEQSQLVNNSVGLLVADADLDLSVVSWIANQVAWQITGRQGLTQQRLVFEDNQQHIHTIRPLALTQAMFNDGDYQQLLTKLEGPITIDFSSLDPKHDLLREWLHQRWMVLLDAVTQGLWQVAEVELQLIAEHQTNHRVQALAQILRFATQQPTTQLTDFIRAVQRVNHSARSGDLWVQNIKIPYKKNIANSDVYIKKQASKKLTHHYLAQHFPQLTTSQIRRHKRSIKLTEHVVASQVIHTHQQGLFLNAWVVHYLDSTSISRDLMHVGLVRKQNRQLTVGILSQAEVFELEEQIIKGLQQQGIQYLSLGTGDYGASTQQRAKQLGADVVLNTRVTLEENASGISQNLKTVEVNLVMDLYDVRTNTILQHLTASGVKSGFKLSHIVKKSVVDLYSSLQNKLNSALWRADDMVIDHQQDNVKNKVKNKVILETKPKGKTNTEI